MREGPQCTRLPRGHLDDHPHPPPLPPPTLPLPQACERDALSQVSGLEAAAQGVRDEAQWLRGQLAERDAALAAQRAVNGQLMAKKQDVEW